MKKISFWVTNEVANAMVTLARRHRVKADNKRTMPRYRAFELLGYMPPDYPFHTFEVDGKIYVKPRRYVYGGRR